MELIDGVGLDQLDPVFEACLGDVLAPPPCGLRILLDRDHAPAEVADSGAEPDRRVPARAADLEHLARGLGSDEAEEELPGRRRDRPRALLGRKLLPSFLGILLLEPVEDGANLIVRAPSARVGLDGDAPASPANFSTTA